MDLEPWNMINNLYPDLVLVVEGKQLYYHQAVLAQHSALIKSLLLKSGCCKCNGELCSRNSDIFISLDDVQIGVVEYVMDIIYSGCGNIGGDTEEYKKVLDMLKIDTILVEEIDSTTLNEIVAEETNSNWGNTEPHPATDNSGERKHEDFKRKRREREFDRKKKLLENKEITTIIDKKYPEISVEPQHANIKDDEAEIVEIINDSRDEQLTKKDSAEKFHCPFEDCSSESRTAQSIKVHLALVHYKKTIQAENPNWRTQKCEECERVFNQMTAYYLHMAQHKNYPYMDNLPLSSSNPGTNPVLSSSSPFNIKTFTSSSKIRSNALSVVQAPPDSTWKTGNGRTRSSAVPVSSGATQGPSSFSNISAEAPHTSINSSFRKPSILSTLKATLAPSEPASAGRRSGPSSGGGQSTATRQDQIMKILRGS